MKKSIIQKKLFDQIQKVKPAHLSLVDAVADALRISNDSVYRRIRGDMMIDIEETVKLCSHFQISMDSLADIDPNKSYIRCRYTPLNLENMKDYMTFVQVASDLFENTRLALEGEIIMSAVDVPIFLILPYRELTAFKLFSWSKSTYGYTADFDAFVKEGWVDNQTLENIHEKIKRNYQLIPSTEIWTTSTTDTILRLLIYHSEMKHFSDKKTPLLLCEQLLDLMNTLQKWAENGTKGPKETPFKFYISETDIANTFILFKNAESSSCLVKLYTINGLGISDENFCREAKQWLHNTARRSTLVSGASEKERRKFFTAQQKKIRLLMESIESN